MSVARRQTRYKNNQLRLAEQSVRCRVATACQVVNAREVPVVSVTRTLALSERTVRRWRSAADRTSRPVPRGRPPRCATPDERNQVYRFLRERGTPTPLAAVRAAFPYLRRADLRDVVRRFRRIQRRKAERHRSRLVWLQPGTVWAADFKERREPIEGRYGWLLSIKDLASRCQLAWLPLVDATGDTVQATYAQLFAEHGPPLVLKSDNGPQFKADETKQLLAQQAVLPLYSPKRHPQYNGGVERANGQLAGYQEALAAYHGRPGLPTCDDAAAARRLANELALPEGWRGPTAGELWEQRLPINESERAAFRTSVEAQRAVARAQLHFTPDEPLTHYPQAAVDRRAIRDALVEHGLLRILPRHPKRGARQSAAPDTAAQASEAERPKKSPLAPQPDGSAGRILLAMTALPTVGSALDAGSAEANAPAGPGVPPTTEEAHSSTIKTNASGQN